MLKMDIVLTGCCWIFNNSILLLVLSFCPLMLEAESCTMRWQHAEKDDQKADANMDYNLESLKELYISFRLIAPRTILLTCWCNERIVSAISLHSPAYVGKRSFGFFFFFLSVKVNTSESLRTWLLSYSFNCGTQTREFYIMELTEFGSILLMCTCIIYTFGTEFLLKQIKYLF